MGASRFLQRVYKKQTCFIFQINIMKENIPRIFRKSKGQIVVEGDINLTSEDGVKIKHGKRFTLCGCTKSKNLPFCDGSHKT